jgi:SAM-dependent methyltransferase
MVKTNLVKCPLCGKFDAVKKKGIRRIINAETVYGCEDCNFLYINKNLDIDTINKLYNKEYWVANKENAADRNRFEYNMERIRRVRIRKPDFKTWLDVGCGMGDFVILLRQQGVESYGIDVSPEIKEVGDLMRGSVENIENKDGYFDVISGIEFIEHLVNPMPTFNKIKELLKIGGILYLETSITEILDDLWNNPYFLEPTHFSFYSMKAFEVIFRQIGFKWLDTDQRNTFIVRRSA